jgi:hypothetical protein
MQEPDCRRQLPGRQQAGNSTCKTLSKVKATRSFRISTLCTMRKALNAHNANASRQP